MIRNYIDLVVCEHDNCQGRFLFSAPAWSHLEKGTRVVVETKKGEQLATVVTSATFANKETDSETAFVLTAMKASWPLKRVKCRILTVDQSLDWDDYEEEHTEEHTEDEETTEV